MIDKLRYADPGGSSVEFEETKVIRITNSLDAKTIMGSILGVLLLLFLYVVSKYNYLLYHTISELFSITVAWSLFLLAWNSRHLSDNKAFVFIGIAFLFVGLIDMVHALSFKGMGVIAEEWGANPATQLWISGRLMESISLLIFPLLFFKHVRLNLVFMVFPAITTFLFIAIFYWKIFPDCYIEGVGLTLFKKVSEYIICIILLTAWLLLYQKKNHLDTTVYRLMAVSIGLTVMGELVFTTYVSVYGFSNLLGHYIKILSFYFLYLAFVRSTLKKPYETLFRELHSSEKKFKSLFEEMISGVALHEIICDEKGNPINYRFLDINFAFENLTGLKREDLIGKTVLEVFPEIESSWIETYGRVALTGNSVQFDNFSKQLNKYFEVRAYSSKYGQFVAVFNDVTDKKQSEIEKDNLIDKLQKAFNEIKMLRGILPICSHCKKIRDDKGYWNQIESYIHEHSEAEFSHGICQECAKKYYPEMDIYAE